MKWKTLFIFIFLLGFSQSTFGTHRVTGHSLTGQLPPAQVASGEIEEDVRSAMLGALVTRRPQLETQLLVSIQVDDIRLSLDGEHATAWILYYDNNLDMFLPTEPGLAIANWDGTAWRVILPGDNAWEQALLTLPEDLLTSDAKEMWLTMDRGESVEANPDSGYNLPWLGGLTGYLSRSVSHDDDFTNGNSHYSYDFFFIGTTICPTTYASGLTSTTGVNGANFDILAAKAGTVWNFKDSVIDCNHDDVNFIVLRNNDNPDIYQLYLHLSQDSIPDELRYVGAPVAQGQFIGRADNTGYSTGSHLHFQIESLPYWPADNPYWAAARDVTFSEVNIYGGHPRREWESDDEYCQGSDDGYLCNEYGRLTYLSANYPSGDSTPPTGGLSGVTLGQLVASQSLTLSGWGDDSGSGLDYMQLTAFYNNSWHDVGNPFTSDFIFEWDLCSPGSTVPDGLVSIALNVYDQAGNVLWLTGLSHFTKDYACPSPPPSCIPGPDQVTLFEGLDYSEGCVMFGIGNYANGDALDPLGNDDAASILVGANVMATLYSESNYGGHSQTFLNSDSNLRDNLVSENRLSSMRVAARTSLPAAPVPVSPAAGGQFKSGDLIILSWRNNGGAVEFQVQLTTPTETIDMPWQSQPSLPLLELSQGAYSWRVRGRNTAGEGLWSAVFGFGVGLPETLPATQTAPYVDGMESSGALWADAGIWSLKTDGGISGSYAWWYQEADGDYATLAPNYGWLTSPPITIPTTGYFLKFYYRYQTETYGTAWDQRWVQISVDGGPFTNFYQLSEDAQYQETSTWLQSPILGLDDFSGSTIQVRFAFYTLDEALNGYLGWGIDDFSITTSGPATCSDLLQDDTQTQASILAYNASLTVEREICPNGDWDYFQFSGMTGERIIVDVDAMADGSLLDPYVLLYDSDGVTLLAENDDEIYAVRRDSLLTFTLPHDGIYFIKVRAWKHPSVGGQDYYYRIRLYEDRVDPALEFLWPQTGSILPDAVFNVLASITDMDGGVHHVDFYWHNQEWQTGLWQLIASDEDGSDGWSASFNPAGQPEGVGAAIYATAYDQAGNLASLGVWDLVIDKSAPTSEMQPLSVSQLSTAFLLGWSGTDNLSGIWYYELQHSLNGGAWTNLGQIDGQFSSQWVVGTAGNSYQYRMHAIDFAGNTEDYPTSAEASTGIPIASTLCATLDIFDSEGNDNSPENAVTFPVNETSQNRNFCNPLDSDYLSDEDWITFPVQSGLTYIIEVNPLAEQTAVVLNLVSGDGTSLISQAAPDQFGENTYLIWSSDRNGMIFVQMQHLDGRVIGSAVAYHTQVRSGYGFFLPMLQKMP